MQSGTENSERNSYEKRKQDFDGIQILSEGNLKFIEETGEKLGMNKTSVLDMLLIIPGKETSLLPKQIWNMLHK